MVIFDCNGVLVDSEPLATAIVSQEFIRAGFPLTPDMIARYFTGRRPADMFADVEFATRRKLPAGFAAGVADQWTKRTRFLSVCVGPVEAVLLTRRADELLRELLNAVIVPVVKKIVPLGHRKSSAHEDRIEFVSAHAPQQ